MMPPTFWKVSNFSAKAAEVAATIIVIIMTTVEWPRLLSDSAACGRVPEECSHGSRGLA